MLDNRVKCKYFTYRTSRFLATREEKNHFSTCLIVKAPKGRHSTEKQEPGENKVPSIQTSLCLPMTHRQAGQEWQSLENLRDQLTTQLSQTVGNLPWQEATRQTGTMQGCVPLPGGCQEPQLTSGCSATGLVPPQ